MSGSSASVLDEAAIITDESRAVAGVRVLIEHLTAGAEVVDRDFLIRAAKIKVRPPRRGSKRRRAVKVRGPRAWLASVVPLDEDRYADEQQLVESERQKAESSTEFSDSDASHLRWTGSSSFRKYAKDGDLIITISKPGSKSKRATVYPPQPLLHRKDKDHVTHFFVEEYADSEDTAIPFSNFKTLWRQAGARGTPTMSSTREVSVDVVERLRSVWPK